MDDAVDHFIESHVRGGVCSVCGASDWFLANDGNPVSFLSFAATHDPRIDVFGVCCGNCGYIRFHAAEIVNRAGGPDRLT
ncbi:MAG: hypothetical protein KY396_08990 [Actinobacteria bacterium]|nr:hypothetical protein [Actinomycetota bacterium]